MAAHPDLDHDFDGHHDLDRNHATTCCPDGACTPHLDRRTFLTASAVGATGAATGALALRAEAAHALGVAEENLVVVPTEKGYTPEQLSALRQRGVPTSYEGDALQTIGMPVGGITAGQVYLGGDGRLWLWDVYNTRNPVTTGWVGGTYQEPMVPSSPFRQGFAIRTSSAGTTSTRALDSTGFGDIRFTGQYPVGTVDYRADDCPVEVRLDAFSPFVPIDPDSSSFPATILSFTVRNTSRRDVDVTLAGWSESPVVLESRSQQPTRLLAADFTASGATGIEFSAREGDPDPDPRPDVVFEDWESDEYPGWTVEGTAFGAGPVDPATVPDYMKRFGDLNVDGARFVTSHNYRDAGLPDDHLGRLTSAPFTIERRYITVGVGGGNWKGEEGVNLLIDGSVVGSATGNNTEPLTVRAFDVGRWEGKTATIEIVDSRRGDWAHVNCDHIVFTDRPASARPLDELPDNGTFALVALDPHADAVPSLADSSTVESVFDSEPGPVDVDASVRKVTGAVRVPMTLEPGKSATVRFAVSWHFPLPRRELFRALTGSDALLYHYSTRFDSARAVATHVASHIDDLESATRSWVKTWYADSTLPHWFLERTLANASILATNTCYRFQDGRFYGEEGTYCCDGTCQHVWNYAQSVARLFPQLERDTRERVDLGYAFHDDTGAMDYRGEVTPGEVAVDGQCGTILRTYREHQMSADDGFLRRVWPRVRKAIEHLTGRDGEPDGILEGAQYNTLDQTWYGEIPWISGLYVATLRAAAEMGAEMGESGFADQCSSLAESGSAYLGDQLFDAEYGYFVQKVDPAHAESTNSNRGSYADQMFGETYAAQLGLPRVFPRDKAVTALQNLYGHNFLSDHNAFRATSPVLSGRWFAADQEPGLLVCTWPFGGGEEAPGGGDVNAVGYFNEVWTGMEYQVAAHMLHEGLVDEALTITRAVYDRYAATKRNPYNEIECSDHYSRAMMSHAVYLAACGYEYHGPRGHIGFAPRISPENFQAAFTAAEGWGSYRQRAGQKSQDCSLEVRRGQLRVASLAFETAKPVRTATVEYGHKRLKIARSEVTGSRIVLTLDRPVTITRDRTLKIAMSLE